MTKIDNLIAELCPDGPEFKALRDVGTWYGGGTPSKAVRAYWENGTVPWLSPKDMTAGTIVDTLDHVSEEAVEKSTLKLVPAGSVAFVVRSNVLRRRLPVALVPIAVTLNQDMRTVVPHEGIVADYLAHACRARADAILAAAGRTDGSMAAIRGPALLDFRIPVPPVAVQQEVVAALDALQHLMTELEGNLKAELEARRQQHEHQRAEILAQGVDRSETAGWPKLEALVSFTNGKPHEQFVVEDGKVALITSRFVSTGGQSARFTDEAHAMSPAVAGDIAMVMSDLPNGKALARCYHVESDGTYTANQRVCLLRISNIDKTDSRYLFHYLDRNPQLLRHDNGQYQTHLKKGDILRISVPPVPLAEQRRVACLLDALDGSVDELSKALRAEVGARGQQYEHYRAQLLTFNHEVP